MIHGSKPDRTVGVFTHRQYLQQKTTFTTKMSFSETQHHVLFFKYSQHVVLTTTTRDRSQYQWRSSTLRTQAAAPDMDWAGDVKWCVHSNLSISSPGDGASVYTVSSSLTLKRWDGHLWLSQRGDALILHMNSFKESSGGSYHYLRGKRTTSVLNLVWFKERRVQNWTHLFTADMMH